jgi:dTDP-4-amino-4,6-dideoxygalactose transaminase
MSQFRYPCTGRVTHQGFIPFLEQNLGTSRRNLQAFAVELKAKFGAQYISLVNSGSSANLASALAISTKNIAGSQALTAGFSFPTTVSSLLSAGLTVTVVDTEAGGFSIDPEAVRRAIRPTTKLLCITHFLGFPADLDTLIGIAKDYDLFVIQDACETMDLRIDGTPAHLRGDLTTWSFYHPHHLPSFGGGAVICANQEWFRLIESITHWGRECTCHFDPQLCSAPEGMDHNFWYVREGHNLEMSELNACFGRFQLQYWEEYEQHRKRNYQLLYESLRDCPEIKVYDAPINSGSPFVFPITTLKVPVSGLTKRLMDRGVEVRSLMGGAITRQPAYKGLEHDGLANCNDLANRSFFVGIHQTLPEEDVATVAAIIREEVLR